MSIKLPKNPRGAGKRPETQSREGTICGCALGSEKKKGTSEESRERRNCNTKDGLERKDIFVKEGT